MARRSLRRWRILLVVPLGCCCIVHAGSARAATQTVLLPAPVEQLGATGLGGAVAVDGSTMVVSAQGADFQGISSGAVVVFQLEGASWIPRSVLTPPTSDTWGWGGAIALDGRTVAVGYAPRDQVTLVMDASPGGDWSSFTSRTITPSGGANDELFGAAVALAGRTLIVGAPSADDGVLTDTGAVYVLTDTSGAGDWSSHHEVKLTPAGLAESDAVGGAVAVKESTPGTVRTLVLGCPARDGAHWGSGSVFVLTDSSAAGDWSTYQQVELTATDPRAYDRLGDSVAVRDGVIAAGAPGRTTGTTGDSDIGAVFLFMNTSAGGDWSTHDQVELTAADPANCDELGTSVALGDGLAAAGAPSLVGRTSSCSDPTDEGGAVHVFTDTSLPGDWSSWTESVVLPTDTSPFDMFGSSVALESSLAVIGAPRADTGAAGSGALYLFDASTWMEERKLTPAGIGDWEQQLFGAAVAGDGSTIIVGVPGLDNGSWAAGAATVFRSTSSSWSDRGSLAPTVSSYFARFGDAVDLEGRQGIACARGGWSDGPPLTYEPAFCRVLVDISVAGDWSAWTAAELPELEPSGYNPVATVVDERRIAVGVAGPLENPAAISLPGVVHIFQDDSIVGDWSVVSDVEITATGVGSSDWFGASLDLQGRTLLVGAPRDDALADDAGAAYLLLDTSVAGDWTSRDETRITAADGQAGDGFGSSVALGEGFAVIGAPSDDDAAAEGGAVYVLLDTSTGGDWGSFEMRKLPPPELATLDEGASFGHAVALWGRTIVVGTPSAQDWGQWESSLEAGAVWVFVDASANGDWSSFLESRLVPSDSQVGDGFGWSVAVAGGVVTVGAPGHTEGELTNGAVYVFDDAIPGANLVVGLDDVPDPVDPGQAIAYGISVSNRGREDAISVEVVLSVSPGVAPTDATGSGWSCSVAGSQATCSRPVVAADTVSSLLIHTTAPEDRGRVDAAVTVTSSVPDPYPDDNAASTATDVLTDILLRDGFESGDIIAWSP